MGNRSILPFGASLVVAVTLGGMSYAAQREALPPKEASTATSVSANDETKPHSIRDALRGLIAGREQQTGETSALDVDSEPPKQTDIVPPPQSEAPFLKDLASWLSVTIPENATSGDIALAIKEALSVRVAYPDTVLSDEAFEECYAAIPTTKDAETFKAYHTFIKKVAGKRVVILKTTHE